MSVQSGLGWNVVAGRNRPARLRGTKGGANAQGGARPKQALKRQRVSTDSTGSTTGASKISSDISTSPLLTIEQFKSLNVDDKLENIFVCLHGLVTTNERLLKAEQTVFEIHNTGQVNKQRIDLLAYKSIDNESRQRRNNLIFWGIPETRNEDCSTVLSEFLSDKLGLDPDAIFIQRAHRVGRFKPRRQGSGQSTPINHRPLIAAFRDYPDVELVISNAGKLKGTRFGINRDYPQEIIDARKPLYKEKKELRSKNPNSNISIRYPAKLVMDGQVIRDMFPDWARVMKQNRLNMQGYTETQSISASVSEQVFHNDENAWSDESEMEHDSDLTQASPGMSQPPRVNRTTHGASSRPPRSLFASKADHATTRVNSDVDSNTPETRPPESGDA